jgi:hypothetical protein
VSWQRIEVAIPVTCPSPFMHVATMSTHETPKRRGGRVFWAEWFPTVRLLVLRATIPQRASLPYDEAALAAGMAARDYWNDGNLSLGMAQLAGPDKVAGWTWPEGEEA